MKITRESLRKNQDLLGTVLGTIIAAGTGANLWKQTEATTTLQTIAAKQEFIELRIDDHERRVVRLEDRTVAAK